MDANGIKAGKRTVVLMLGEDWNLDPVTLEVILGQLSRAAERVVFLVARKRRLLDGRAAKRFEKDCERALEAATGLGLDPVCREIVSGHPLEEAPEACRAIAKEFPAAIFCFVWWGLKGHGPSLRERLKEMALPTGVLSEVLIAGSKEAANEL